MADQGFPPKRVTLQPHGATMVLRPLSSPDEFEACVHLQEDTWGKGFSERVPESILMVNQKIGGVSAGAFDERDTLQGFVFGMTGLKEGRKVHWSDMLAVRPEFRNAGLGRDLKLYQRECVLSLGVDAIYWTYDPLVARNAHLNLNKLGAEVDEYVVDMYPDDSSSELHRGLGMDRFIVVWNIRSSRVADRLEGKSEMSDARAISAAPIVNPNGVLTEGKEEKILRIEIPDEILEVRSRSAEEAYRWRLSTRSAFQRYLTKGYVVSSIVQDREHRRWHYVLRSGG